MRTFQSSGLRAFPLILTAVCLLLVVIPARATIMQYMEVEELTKLSSDVFHGQVLSTSVDWNAEHTRIYTTIRVRISEAFKGGLRRDQLITVTQLGGEKDGMRMDYVGRPEFAAGEWVALFTVRGKRDDFIVVGLKQGKMRVEGSEVKRDFTGLMLVDSAAGGGALRPITPKTTRLTLNELRTRVRGVK
ncbi:MAG: hypothetical protein SF339_24340 [Blastocatellia bacterium]|nr:hypothetical protein [Blastocatellia bacterium]